MNHIVILAGGEGRRLEGPARARYGYARPKQYCDFGDGMTLLDRSLVRAHAIVEPEGILVVTTKGHHREAEEVLRRWPGVQWLEQPQNRDTLPGLALPILTLLAQDSHACVAVLPSDHAVEDDDAFVECVARSLAEVPYYPYDLLLLGTQLAAPEAGYGWILPAASRRSLPQVAAFLEKPPEAELPGLIASGALANTFVMAGYAWTFADLILKHAPSWFHGIVRGLADESQLTRVYEALPAANFSHVVLEPACERLRVLSMPPVGWSDVGTPERLARVLEAHSSHHGV